MILQGEIVPTVIGATINCRGTQQQVPGVLVHFRIPIPVEIRSGFPRLLSG